MPIDHRVFAADVVDALIAHLRTEGYEVLAPALVDGTIDLHPVESAADLAAGNRLETAPGVARVAPDPEQRVFASVVGPGSARAPLLPRRHRLFTADRDPTGEWEIGAAETDPPRTAIVGVRACDLAAIAIQDRVFLDGAAPDPIYAARREQLLLVAVPCAHATETCFCASVGTGPEVQGGADIVLTEVTEGEHRFVGRALNDRGTAVLDALASRPATQGDVDAAEAVPARAAAEQTRRLDPDARRILRDAVEHPRWEEIAQRCLTCANCTLVCPTCFCTEVEDVTDLSGSHTERWRRWDSCFAVAYTHTATGPVRSTAASRYRQWLSHKLDTWVDQFGTSGCVGCGRCIVWCPVGIDLTAEVDLMANAQTGGRT